MRITYRMMKMEKMSSMASSFSLMKRAFRRKTRMRKRSKTRE